MKHQWLAYLIVGLLSVGAGVAIAGLPDNVSVDATITPPTTTEAPAPTVPETTVAPESTAPTTTVPATTVPATTEPDTTDPETTDPDTDPETTDPETTDPETTDPDTTDPETTDPEPDDSVPAELPERSELAVVTANGANVAGAARRAATLLEELGYADVLPLNGTSIVEFTVVYFAEGFEDAALRLAADLDLLPDFVAPIDGSPSVADLPADTELLAYIGRDRA